MRVFATHRHQAILLTLALSCWVTAGAQAQQVPTTWDHYKVYDANPNITAPVPPIFLSDQFQGANHNVQFLDYFMTPTEKHLLPPPGSSLINEPFLHYTWWRITHVPFDALVAATNQFGDQTFNVSNGTAAAPRPEYLLNPTLKNQSGSPPLRNHYKCYSCTGNPIQRDVRLNDQYGEWITPVLFPRYLCTPVTKQVQGQPPDQIVDPNRHYVCYDIQPDPAAHIAVVTDQFVTNQTLDLQPGIMLCVPTVKLGVTDTRKDTWGRLKMMYR